MIEGRKPNGYLVTGDGETLQKRELETRQCCHCQFTWIYNPHDESRARNIRGFCLRHYGFTCERPECRFEQAQMLLEFPGQDCVSFYEYYQHRLETINRDPLWEVTPSGVIMPKSDGPGLPGLYIPGLEGKRC